MKDKTFDAKVSNSFKKVRSLLRNYFSTLKITLPFLLIAGCWILFSDYFTHRLLETKAQIAFAQTYKGLVFIFMTGLFVFKLIRHYKKLLQQNREENEKLNKVLRQHKRSEMILKYQNKELNNLKAKMEKMIPQNVWLSAGKHRKAISTPLHSYIGVSHN